MIGMKAIVTVSTIKGYANGAYATGWNFSDFTKWLQEKEEYMFSDTSISWLITPGIAVYKTLWGATKGGEEVFVLTTDYTEYDEYNGISVKEWKKNIINHAQYLKDYFQQSTIRVSFIDNVENIILK